jgi:O-acetyl-ADP-ribose deacetylase (regulator of RNase III)
MTVLRAIKGDITKVASDAIVNAANSSLLGGGGVDGAIHKAGGPAILAECRVIRDREGGCATGNAVITTAGRLPARYVIHTVGPVWVGDPAREAGLCSTLGRCYERSLALAALHGCTSVAFPNISTGVYRFPKVKAAGVAVGAVRRFVAQDPRLEVVTFVCFDDENLKLYSEIL